MPWGTRKVSSPQDGPGRHTLYAALRSAPFPVTAFAVDAASGRLSHRGTAPLPAPMAYISVRGSLLMGASYKEGKLSVSRILGQARYEVVVSIGVGKALPPLPPNRTGGFPAYGSPVSGSHIGSVSHSDGPCLARAAQRQRRMH